MLRKTLLCPMLVCCAAFFTNLKGSENTDVWVAQNSDSDRYFTAKKCYINPAEERTLAFDRPGTIDDVIFEEGDTVKANEIVARLRAEVAEAAKEVARIKAEGETEIEFAKASRDVAEVDYKTSYEINKKSHGVIADTELRRLELEWKKSEASILMQKDQKEIAEFELNQAKAELSTYEIPGRIDGVVTKIFKKSGEAVRQGDPVMTIIDVKRVTIEGSLPVPEAVQVKQGTLVLATLPKSPEDNRPHKEYRGTVIFVDEIASRTKIPKKRIKAEFANPDGKLIPGLMATLRFYPDIDGPEVPRKKKPAITAIQ